MSDQLLDGYDVVVTGGGAAGLSGALMLGRSRRSVLVVDAGAPRNRAAAGVHGLLGLDGVAPADLLERGRAEVRSYGGHVISGAVVGVAPNADGFVVALDGGRRIRARRILVASGLVDELPDIPGVRQRWGHDVVHCPYCHGWEARDEAIGVLGSGPMSMHQALLFRQLSDDIVYFSHRGRLDADATEQLAARDIRVVEGEVASLAIEGNSLTGVRLADGTVVPRAILVVGPKMVARSSFLTDLGLYPVPHAWGLGDHIPVDATGCTSVPGVWAAGNVTDLSANVGASAVAGATAGAHINADLVAEETRLAQEAFRERSLAAS